MKKCRGRRKYRQHDVMVIEHQTWCQLAFCLSNSRWHHILHRSLFIHVKSQSITEIQCIITYPFLSLEVVYYTIESNHDDLKQSSMVCHVRACSDMVTHSCTNLWCIFTGTFSSKSSSSQPPATDYCSIAVLSCTSQQRYFKHYSIRNPNY
jgi:hypothetical protein